MTVPVVVNSSGGDDTSAIQTALNSGGWVYLPDALYKVTSVLTLSSNTRLSGGPNTTLYDPNYRTTSKHRFLSAVNQSNVFIENMKVFGNDSSYAVTADGFSSQADSFSNGCGIFFSGVTFGGLANIETKYMWESAVILSCNDVTVDGFKSHQDQSETQHALGLVGNTNCHVRRAHVTNGSDGALYIYNGSYCSIRDSIVEYTAATGVGNATGSGMESCDGCVIDNVVAINCWIGFACIEGVRNGLVTNCHATGCNAGFLIGQYGTGSSIGIDLTLSFNRITNIQDLGLGDYPPSGFLIHTNSPTALRLIGNYVGLSQLSDDVSSAFVGAAINADFGSSPTVPVKEFTVIGNTFEAATYDQSVSGYKNTGHILISIGHLSGGVISGNTFVTKSSNDSNAQILFTGSADVQFVDNKIWTGGSASNSLVSLDSNCYSFTIADNEFQNSSGSYVSLTLAGQWHTVTGNHFRSEGGTCILLSTVAKCAIVGNHAPNISTGTFIDWSGTSPSACIIVGNDAPSLTSGTFVNLSGAAASNYVLVADNVGYAETISQSSTFTVSRSWQKHKIISTASCSGTLPAAVIGDEFTFTSTSGTLSIHPAGTDVIRYAGSGHYITLGSPFSATLRCMSSGSWDIISAFGTVTVV